MLHWKEKVADKLSRFLADSPSSSSHATPKDSPSSPVVRPEPKVLFFDLRSLIFHLIFEIERRGNGKAKGRSPFHRLPCRVCHFPSLELGLAFPFIWKLGLAFRPRSAIVEEDKMLHWKEKVADKLSRFLADSPSSSSHATPKDSPSSPVVRPEPKVLPFPKEELYRPESASFPTVLLSLIPTVSPGLGRKSSKFTGQRESSSSSRRLLPSKWSSKRFSWKDRSLDHEAEFGHEQGGYETLEFCEEEDDHVSERNGDSSEKTEETSTSANLTKFPPDTTEESSFISSDLYEFLQSTLPNIVKGCQWVLLYSTMKHGISLRTLLRKSGDLAGPCLLIAGDMQGAIFGGLLECPLNPTAKRKYQGTNQTFVFTTIYGEPRLFRATGANRYYYLCLNDLLALGGGDSFALCLDGDLLHGTSGPCETFGNLCLAHNPEFELKNVELWGFTHSTRYLM
ncbi:uncharacterized protein LOC131246990 [Magnolia sinica]|nr:uncharacterized protein LOC131246990 [Magnolia sinica]